MSKKSIGRDAELSHVKVEVVRHKQRRNTHTAVATIPYDVGVKGIPKVSSRSTDFVYVNNAYVGSLNSINDVRIQQPPTSVYREQYWACSKWSLAKKVLAIVAGVVLGAGIGLAVTLLLRRAKDEDQDFGGIFRSSAPD